MTPRLHDDLEELSRLSVAEMLHEMAADLKRLTESPNLSGVQQDHVCRAERHITATVEEWVDDVRGEEPSPRRKRSADDQRLPAQPERGLECVLEMLAIYHDDIDERDFTSLQVQRLMIVAYNLLLVAGETTRWDD